MKADVKDGLLVLTPESATEEYGLKCWRESNLISVQVSPPIGSNAVACERQSFLSTHSVLVKSFGEK
jgi:hypothetical protein